MHRSAHSSVCLIVTHLGRGRTARIDLRAGASGFGQVLHTVEIDVWTWSLPSALHVFACMARAMYQEVFYHDSVIPFLG